uniref:Uncharacterized protein n=1 Tax=Rhizophora mucronata TaxID=61149 RepID=A0A2P2QZD8_RHIMU
MTAVRYGESCGLQNRREKDTETRTGAAAPHGVMENKNQAIRHLCTFEFSII